MTAPEPIEPDAGSPPEQIADELFVHGLLQAHGDDALSVQKRVAAVMSELQAERSRRSRAFLVWAATAAAAACVVAAIAWWFATPDPQDIVAEIVRAASRSGPRRYAVEASWSGAGTDVALRGEVDVLDERHYLLKATVHGVAITTGSDGGPPWFAGDPALVAHLEAAHHHEFLPPFAMDRSVPTFGSPDEFIARLATDYHLRRSGEGSVEGHPGVAFEVLRGERATAVRVPDRVELFVHPESRAVQQLRLVWLRDPPRPLPAGTADSQPVDSMVLDLVGEVTLPPDWFEAARHR